MTQHGTLELRELRNIANFKYCDDPLADAFVGPRWENVSTVCKETGVSMEETWFDLLC